MADLRKRPLHQEPISAARCFLGRMHAVYHPAMPSQGKTNQDMDLTAGFFLNGSTKVLPMEGCIESDGERVAVQRLEMRVLLCLAKQAGRVVAKDDIIDEVWGGRAVAPEALTQKISALRRHLGDDTSNPMYIETIAKIGNRLIADVACLPQDTDSRVGPSNDVAAKDAGHLGEPSGTPYSLFTDLRRRKVFRMAYLYGAVGWLVTQVAETFGDVLNLPELAVRLTVLAVLIGFPVALALAYFLEVGPDGSVRKTPPRHGAGRLLVQKTELALIATCGVAVVVFLAWWFQTNPPPPGADLISLPPRSIAVVPFENLSPEPSDAYFGKGLSEDIRLQLTRRSSLVVAARALTRDAVSGGSSIGDIGQQLGTSRILTGTVRKFGPKIRVTVSLIDVELGSEIWADAYDAKTTDPLSLQIQLSQTIAVTLAQFLDALNVAGVGTGKNVATQGFEAYSRYLQGLDLLGQARSSRTLALAHNAFQAAIDADPDYAGAHVGVCETELAQFVSTGNTMHIDRAVSSCDRALALDPGLAQAQLALGKLSLQQGKFDMALRAFDAAISRDSAMPEAYSGRGEAHSRMGNTILAEQDFIAALTLRPDWAAYNNLGGFVIRLGRYEDAAAYYRAVTKLNPANPHGFSNLGAALYLGGDLAGAADAYQASLAIEPGRAAYSNLGFMSYYLGRFSDAAVNFEKALGITPDDYRLWGNMGDSLRFNQQRRAYDATMAYKRAIKLVGTQLETNMNDDAAWASLAWYQSNLGDIKSADENIEKALAIDPDNRDTLYVQALILALRDEVQDSILALTAAIAQDYPRQIIEATPEFKKFRSTDAFRAMLETEPD